MAFVASGTTATITSTALFPIPKIADVSGNCPPLILYSHVQLTNTVAAGTLTMQTDASPQVIVVAGVGSAIAAVPPNATTVTVGVGAGGSGTLMFGRHS